jgi:hypothetical protein
MKEVWTLLGISAQGKTLEINDVNTYCALHPQTRQNNLKLNKYIYEKNKPYKDLELNTFYQFNNFQIYRLNKEVYFSIAPQYVKPPTQNL